MILENSLPRKLEKGVSYVFFPLLLLASVDRPKEAAYVLSKKCVKL